MEYDRHVEVCGSRTDFCDKCNLRVILRDMEEHKLTKCGDLKAENFREEPTLENLPPFYGDGYQVGEGPGRPDGGPLLGRDFNPTEGYLPPGYFFPGDASYFSASGGAGVRERERNDTVQVSSQNYLCSHRYSRAVMEFICTCIFTNRLLHIHVYITVPYHNTPHHTTLCHTIPYHTIPYHTVPHHTGRSPVAAGGGGSLCRGGHGQTDSSDHCHGGQQASYGQR